MSIAVVSIVSSFALALATIANNYFQHKSRLAHERVLAFDNRSWEAKSTALNGVIHIAAGLQERSKAELFFATEQTVDDLRSYDADLYVYASVQCRDDLNFLIGLLEGYRSRINPMNVWMRDEARLTKMKAIEESDLTTARDAVHQEREAEANVLSEVGSAFDEGMFRKAAGDLMSSAKKSLRGGI